MIDKHKSKTMISHLHHILSLLRILYEEGKEGEGWAVEEWYRVSMNGLVAWMNGGVR